MTFRFQLPRKFPQAVLCVILSSLVAACASVPLKQGASLASYEGMRASGGMLVDARLRVDSAAVLSAKTVRIVPTTQQIGGGAFEAKDLALVTNAIDRALCIGLSDRFQVVASNQPADLTVHAKVTGIVATNRTAAATSTVASLGASAVLPVPIPRLPIGLGGLSVEAEAIGHDGSQRAAMLWSRGANMITNKARVSEVGDAYTLSAGFGADFTRMLVTGQDPFKGVAIPSMQKISASFGGSPKYEACKAFGAAPGIKGMAANQLGLPPAWTDKGAAPTR